MLVMGKKMEIHVEVPVLKLVQLYFKLGSKNPFLKAINQVPQPGGRPVNLKGIKIVLRGIGHHKKSNKNSRKNLSFNLNLLTRAVRKRFVYKIDGRTRKMIQID